MYRPVHPSRLAVLAGAVQRVHDPDPVGRQARRIVPYPLLGEHLVTWPPAFQRGDDQVVGLLVPGRAQRVGVGDGLVGAQVAQQHAGLAGEPAGEGAIDGGGHQYAPEARHTADRVRSRIIRSRENDQFSTYRRSSLTASSQGRSERPETC